MMFNNALMRFFPRPMGVPNLGTNVPNMGNTGMLNPIPFEGGMPNTYKQPQIGLPFEGGNKSGFFPGPFGLSNARNALMGIGGYRGSGMNIRQEY